MIRLKALFSILVTFTILTVTHAQFGGPPPYTVEINEVDKGAKDKVSIDVIFDLPDGIHAYTQKDQFFDFKVTKSTGLGKPTLTMPELKSYTDLNGDTSDVLFGKKTVRVTLPYAGNPGSTWILEGTMGSQACDDKTCFPPHDETFSFTGTIPEGAVILKAEPDAQPPPEKTDEPKPVTTTGSGGLIDAGGGFILLDAELGDLPFEFEVKGQSETAEDGIGAILKYILFAFLGGLILNIMPCVLPVLSIKAMSIVNSAHKDRKEIFKGSMAYTLGILVSFLVLATLVAVAKAAGRQAGWGDQMQNPTFVVVLFIIIWVFALSLFDVFIIQLPGMQAASKASSKGGHLGSFLSGVFAVLLSTPCTAPLLGSAVGFLFAQSIPLVYVSFIAIGLGLALPFILLGLTPKAVKWIPKPGGWMNIFREVMGFFLLATAVFLAFILKSQLGEHFFSFLIFVLPLSFACWLYGKAAGPGVELKRNIVVFLLVIGIIVGSGYYLIKIPKVEHANNNLTAELMRKALFEEDRMVFLDFGADWCATCKFFEKTVLNSDKVQSVFKEKDVLLLKGDFTNRDPKINEWLQRFDRAGVPLYVVLKPGSKVVAERLPDAITPQIVINALETD